MAKIDLMKLGKEERLEAIKAQHQRSLPQDQRERMLLPSQEIRMSGDEDGQPRHIEGYGAVFNKDSEGLWFTERIAPGAFTNTIANDDIICAFNHDRSLLLGRKSAGTLEITEDSIGAFYSVIAPDTQIGRDLPVMIDRGDVKGSSFTFQTIKDQWEYSDDGEVVVRTLLELKCFEMGPVTSPVYNDTTTSARSLNDWIEEQRENPEIPEDNWEIDILQRRLDLAKRK